MSLKRWTLLIVPLLVAGLSGCWPEDKPKNVLDLLVRGDCNDNGYADDADIANGVSLDCNENGVPDECEIADGSVLDRDGNGVPDECEPVDCDGNGVDDRDEIAADPALDCDRDGVLDVCEPDADSDGVIDDCDGCPDDPSKVDPGTCGCGYPDVDLDGDGLPDCTQIAGDTARVLAFEDDNAAGKYFTGCFTAEGRIGSAAYDGNFTFELDLSSKTSAPQNQADFDWVNDGVHQWTLRWDGEVAEFALDGVILTQTFLCEDINAVNLRLRANKGGGVLYDLHLNGDALTTVVRAGPMHDAPGLRIAQIRGGVTAPFELTGYVSLLWPLDDAPKNSHLAFQITAGQALYEDFGDCNGNRVDDRKDLDDATSADCNENGVPDECDIARGISRDIDLDGVPDECVADCNGNGVPDAFDIAQGDADDCNGNGVPDACDILSGTSADVDGNGVPDACDPDCDGNGILDAVDIANGAADCDGNGVLDVCELDRDGDGVIDACDGCPDDPNKTQPGACGCGVADTDANGNGLPDCVDSQAPLTLTWIDDDADDFELCFKAEAQAGDGALPNLNFTHELMLHPVDSGPPHTRNFTWQENTEHALVLVYENGTATLSVDDIVLSEAAVCDALNAFQIRAHAAWGALDVYDLSINGELLGDEADLSVSRDGVKTQHLRVAGHMGDRVELRATLYMDWHWLFKPIQSQLELRIHAGTVELEEPEPVNDCNENGIEDARDILDGNSADCNENAIPDECELASGAALDVNGNGVPDACEADCDGNNVPDDVDLASGAADCNGNGVIDFCDIAAGTSQDANSNGVPDECETDCDGNGVPDDVDLAQPGADCNDNGLLDACEINDGAADVNSNGVLDECEADCNNNGVPDDLDIANNDAADCNGNGVPDSCDLANGAADANSNGVPDECEADCNGNGVPDDIDLTDGAADCNSNGVPDSCDIASGLSADLNANGVPDECETDCNENGQPDDYDISSGASNDANANGVPDDCEPDCNGNGLPDDLDLSSGASADCNSNGVPDECDITDGTSLDENGNSVPDECDPDCNGNGVPDDLDIARGDASDCNGNGVPDSCDIADATSVDENGNSVPDECDPDCNNNNVPDDLDISRGDALDCNANGVPDSCDVADGTVGDVNGNGVPDVCDPDCNNNGVPDDHEIATNAAQDCNNNGVPDSCDIAGDVSADENANGVPDECDPDCNNNGVPDDLDLSSGAAQDCNGNGVPDSCDIANAVSVDANGNGVPDECDPDCNGNGIPDDLDIADGVAEDCDGNGVPDGCDLASGADDRNGNGVLDACDPDCNSNNVPDDLDIADGVSTDCNADGVPDECQPDADGDGVIDDCDVCPDTPAGRSVDATGCEPLRAEAGNGQVLPELKLITLSGSAQGGVAPYTFVWSAPGWDGAETAEVQVFPTETTTYTLTVMDSSDPPQEVTDQVTIAIVPKANLQYEITDLGALSASGVKPTGVNDSGVVVGYYYTDSYQKRAFIYENGVLQDLGHLGGGESHAYDINNVGEIVGESRTAAGAWHAFRWTPNDGMADLGTPGGPSSTGNAINELGEVVGYGALNGTYYGFVWRDGVMEVLGGDYVQSGAFDINDNGEVVGTIVHADTYKSTGFVYSNGALIDLGSPLLSDSQTWVINNDGLMAGYSWEAALERAFILAGDYVLDLGTLPNHERMYVYGISNPGQIVGEAGSATWGQNSHAFIFTGGELHDLNHLLVNGHGWDELTAAQDVSDTGQIVGYGLKNGVERGFLLTPVEP